MLDIIIDIIEEEACKLGIHRFNLRQYAYNNGYYQTHYIMDDDGNVVDTEYVLTRQAVQDIADIFLDGFDVLNY